MPPANVRSRPATCLEDKLEPHPCCSVCARSWAPLVARFHSAGSPRPFDSTEREQLPGSCELRCNWERFAMRLRTGRSLPAFFPKSSTTQQPGCNGPLQKPAVSVPQLQDDLSPPVIFQGSPTC